MPTVFPANLLPSEITFGLQSNTQVFRSPLTASIQTLRMPGAAWTGRATFTDLEAIEARVLQAFLTDLDGMNGRFYFGDFGTRSRPPLNHDALDKTTFMMATPLPQHVLLVAFISFAFGFHVVVLCFSFVLCSAWPQEAQDGAERHPLASWKLDAMKMGIETRFCSDQDLHVSPSWCHKQPKCFRDQS